jgi:hypothetical protein
MRLRKGRVLALTLGLLLIAAPATAGGGITFDGVLFGLANGPRGTLLVADATAGIHVVKRGEVKATLPLPGATDVSPIGKKALWATTGAGDNPEADTGQALYRISGSETKQVVNLFEFEATRNPDGNDPPDSNPFDVQSLGWRAALVADAGGNDLLKVRKNGHVKVLAVFPDELVSTENLKSLAGCPTPPIPDFAGFCDLPEMMPAQAVPTSVAIGPDGHYYVGELRGFPGPAGASSIWRVSPHAKGELCPNPKCVKVFDGGFTSIIDLAFGPHGKLYVAEMDEASWAAVEIFQDGVGGTINKCSLRTKHCREVATGIPILTAIAFGDRGALYATKNALIPGEAQVIRIK